MTTNMQINKAIEEKERTKPGATKFTPIFRVATSFASERVNPSSPALLALYTHCPELPFTPTTEPEETRD